MAAKESSEKNKVIATKLTLERIVFSISVYLAGKAEIEDDERCSASQSKRSTCNN